ncbi:MAG: GGDEF domain-containing protein [Pseudomonadota bacterium]
MKVTGTQAGRPVARTRQTERASGSGGAKGPAPVSDKISVAGIPEAELTPRVREALMSLLSEVADLRRELAQAREEMRELKSIADTDPLLAIMNRRAFVQELNRSLSMVERYETPASLLFIDLNDLKKINDNLGHAAGDAALQHVAAVLKDNIRQTDVVGRLGGDEFGVILMVTDEAQAATKAERLRQALYDAPIELEGRRARLSIAVGVVGLHTSVTAEEALGAADAKMYAHKKQTKARAS